MLRTPSRGSQRGHEPEGEVEGRCRAGWRREEKRRKEDEGAEKEEMNEMLRRRAKRGWTKRLMGKNSRSDKLNCTE